MTLSEQVAALEQQHAVTLEALATRTAERDMARTRIVELEASTPATRVWSDDFTGDWKARWGVGSAPNLGNMVPQPDGSVVLKCAARKAGVMGWHAAPIPMGDHVRLSYTLAIPQGWEWTNDLTRGGGKAPGLGGSFTRPVTANVGSGGKRWNADVEVDRDHLDDADTMSARVVFSKTAQLHAYLYARNPVGPINNSISYYGATITSNAKRQAHIGENRITLEVASNTPGRPDGLVALTLDDVELVHRDDITWRSTRRPTLRWSQIFGAFAFGGGDSDGPDQATTVTLKDFRLEVLG